MDVVLTEENDGSSPNAEVMWYPQSDDPATAEWERRVVVEQFTTNGLDVADLDGDLDLVTGEHRGTKQVSVWENAGSDDVGGVKWTEHPVDEGKESHLGARVRDLDHDGDLEIISIVWDGFPYLYLWISNDGVDRS